MRFFTVKNRLLFLLLLVSFVTPIAYTASFFDSLLLGLEKDIGQNSYQKIVAERRVKRLPEEDEQLLNGIFDRLVATCNRKNELEYSLTVVEDNTINAFALPGGYIFAHTGLLNYVQSEGELAGVLAHEIAHVDLSHGMKTLGRQLGFSLLWQLVMGNHSPEQIAKIGAIAINLTQLGYGREAEFEADRHGVIFMSKAGYSKKEFLNFWRRLQEESGEGKDPAFLQIFSTHPPTSERIKRIEEM